MVKATKTRGKRSPTKKRPTNRHAVVVRTYSAGVHFGYLASRDGREVTLNDARRAFRFQIDHMKHRNGQVTCSELAVHGPAGDSKIAARVTKHILLDVIEIIDASPEAVAAFERWPA